MEHVRYIDKTAAYYLSQGYDKPYAWAQHDTVPFAPLGRPEESALGSDGETGQGILH